MSNEILSVGIDVGTTTTQVIFSKLVFENSANYFTVPKVSIVEKEVIYKSDIYFTPLLKYSLIDMDGLTDIILREYEKAGFDKEDVKTGAVIITGESARKENSETVLNGLSEYAGDFVVATAGPDLEAIIAGKGSGAYQYSMDHGKVIVNLDIGGGTTNVVVFDNGNVYSKGCWNLGGRIIRIDNEGTVEYISDSAKTIIESLGLDEKVVIGNIIDRRINDMIINKMAQLIAQILGVCPPEKLLEKLRTSGSSEFFLPENIDAICFSGGVAEAIYNKVENDDYNYGDIGIGFGTAVGRQEQISRFPIIQPKETIRATVVGAGIYTTSVTGSTIYFDREILPLKSIPVLKVSKEIESECYYGNSSKLKDNISWFLEQSGSESAVIAIYGKINPEYHEVVNIAKCIAESHMELMSRKNLIVCVENDMAKALGQQIIKVLGDEKSIICIDGIKVESNDYLDLGEPVINDLAIPVIIKTLIYG
ncbi:ethanolamine utilization protein EutA [Dethiosulfatibacter aminovorans DSM 17477]|uniref:Ethanolamine utilization protein EutA n=1 Tax=Dethiosulfatibacter aminovorans DSM 17477 TaxID=1121476 RepID=A0A1M6DR10_9FIRM|nr:ethanolamine ammonia-lyase reactivating factor EutA [Dethiosulfatibacter aminovorans]SHI75613.1 ethanolamine utilization protein EutA [Dethiosulfatibacter aminovorans DSM 17477]